MSARISSSTFVVDTAARSPSTHRKSSSSATKQESSPVAYRRMNMSHNKSAFPPLMRYSSTTCSSNSDFSSAQSPQSLQYFKKLQLPPLTNVLLSSNNFESGNQSSVMFNHFSSFDNADYDNANNDKCIDHNNNTVVLMKSKHVADSSKGSNCSPLEQECPQYCSNNNNGSSCGYSNKSRNNAESPFKTTVIVNNCINNHANAWEKSNPMNLRNQFHRARTYGDGNYNPTPPQAPKKTQKKYGKNVSVNGFIGKVLAYV